LPGDRSRPEVKRGGIFRADLTAVLRADLGPRADERFGRSVTRFDLRRAMLEHQLRMGPVAELRWFVASNRRGSQWPRNSLCV